MATIMPGAEPFFYQNENSDAACLLLHGFTATPQEMCHWGEFLYDCGLTVHCPLLAGHGTDVRDLNATTWRDWYGSAYEGWCALQQSAAQVFAIGLSLGAALALYLAAHVPLSGVVVMATPLVLDTKLLWLARALKYLRPYRIKGPSHINDPQALAARVAYDQTPTRSSEQALLFLRHLYDQLPKVQTPVLLMHSRHDQTIEPATMPRIYQQLGTKDKRMLWLENSGHIVTEDYDRQLVYATIRNFIEQHR